VAGHHPTAPERAAPVCLSNSGASGGRPLGDARAFETADLWSRSCHHAARVGAEAEVSQIRCLPSTLSPDDLERYVSARSIWSSTGARWRAPASSRARLQAGDGTVAETGLRLYLAELYMGVPLPRTVVPAAKRIPTLIRSTGCWRRARHGSGVDGTWQYAVRGLGCAWHRHFSSFSYTSCRRVIKTMSSHPIPKSIYTVLLRCG